LFRFEISIIETVSNMFAVVLKGGMVFVELSAIKPTKIYEEIVEQLKNAILSGEFQPGSRLPSVRELSQQLCVGQAAVREALSALKAMGLVTLKQGEGTFVNRYDPHEITKSVESVAFIGKEDILSLLELRKIIETGTARLAAKRRTTEDLVQIETVLAKMAEDLSSASLGEEADWEFHYAVATASKNPFLLSLMEAIGEKIKSSLLISRRHLYQISGSHERLLRDHKTIFQAIQAGDQRQAEESMLIHLIQVEEFLKIGD
jgi:GntR family transcriptional repressor for pyruvate dehydrogenase complex